MSTNPAHLRVNYTRDGLTEANAPETPFPLFQRWFDEALASATPEPNAMTLATVDSEGHPAARIVLLKGFDPQGFVFFTNYDSRKGAELEARPHAALVFWWPLLERQVRVEGSVERVDAATSDAYFDSRPHGSQLGAWASPQSTVIEGRSTLEQRLAALEATYAGDQPVPRPPYWGGYRVRLGRIEFWQGRPNRLHDRLRYTNAGDQWQRERLAP